MILPEENLKALVINAQIIDEKNFAALKEWCQQTGTTLSEALVEKDYITDEKLGLLIADYLKLPFVVLSKTPIPEDVFHIVPEKIARRKKVIAFARDPSGIKIAASDPTNKEILDLIARKTGSAITTFYATEQDIENVLKLYRKDLQTIFDTFFKDASGEFNERLYQNAPIAKIVDLLIQYAYEDKTSDIHIEPQEKESLVRFRIDGMLHDMVRLPKILHEQVISRIKVLSRLRTDEHLSAQDGKMRIKLEEENLDIRVSIIPIVEGEKAVLRLLASKFRQFSLIDLGMSEEDMKIVENAYNKSFGMVLSTGPTGSGKTTSIYAILKILNRREKNITTIEDPVEYRLKGVNQIQVNVKTNLTFANGLRSILRQDPNIIFVGEIRDTETAGIAVNAALTGHLVLSTLHTNDAATALPRLVDMEVEPFLVASTVNVIIAQRLIRKICEMCKASIATTQKELEQQIPAATLQKNFGPSNDITIYKGEGCKICHSTGYEGRIGIFEVLEVTPDLKELISKKHDSNEILKAALANGMKTMLDDGLLKVKKGLTTIEEVLRVTKVETL